MSYPLASLTDQVKNADLGESIALTECGGGCAGHVLSNHAVDRLRVQALTDLPFSATASTPSWPPRRLVHEVRQQGGVQFESPQADHAYFRPTRVSKFEPKVPFELEPVVADSASAQLARLTGAELLS
jgi:hypothetical protein